MYRRAVRAAAHRRADPGAGPTSRPSRPRRRRPRRAARSPRGSTRSGPPGRSGRRGSPRRPATRTRGTPRTTGRPSRRAIATRSPRRTPARASAPAAAPGGPRAPRSSSCPRRRSPRPVWPAPAATWRPTRVWTRLASGRTPNGGRPRERPCDGRRHQRLGERGKPLARHAFGQCEDHVGQAGRGVVGEPVAHLIAGADQAGRAEPAQQALGRRAQMRGLGGDQRAPASWSEGPDQAEGVERDGKRRPPRRRGGRGCHREPPASSSGLLQAAMIPSAWRPAWRSSTGPWAASQTGGRRTSGRNGARREDPVDRRAVGLVPHRLHDGQRAPHGRGALGRASRTGRPTRRARRHPSRSRGRRPARPPAIASTSAAIFAAICGGR